MVPFPAYGTWAELINPKGGTGSPARSLAVTSRPRMDFEECGCCARQSVNYSNNPLKFEIHSAVKHRHTWGKKSIDKRKETRRKVGRGQG